jgi:hypothetical protein
MATYQPTIVPHNELNTLRDIAMNTEASDYLRCMAYDAWKKLLVEYRLERLDDPVVVRKKDKRRNGDMGANDGPRARPRRRQRGRQSGVDIIAAAAVARAATAAAAAATTTPTPPIAPQQTTPTRPNPSPTPSLIIRPATQTTRPSANTTVGNQINARPVNTSFVTDSDCELISRLASSRVLALLHGSAIMKSK